MRKSLLVLLLLVPITLVSAEKITIIHTNDLHSHLLGWAPTLDYTPQTVNDDNTVGGFARIKHVINQIRSEKQNTVLLFDAGDFTMGSAFHLRCREDAFELELMHRFGYDAVALGNHEFDLRPDGLARMLNSAALKNRLPLVLASNVTFDPDKPGDDTLAECFEKKMVVPFQVIEAEGLKLGVFSIMGQGAISDSPYSSPVVFTDPFETARKTVFILREKFDVDGVICLSHGGLSDNRDKSVDEILAQEVPGIDIIISGHSHTRTIEPVMVGSTIITQSGSYGEYLGILDLEYDGNTGFTVAQYDSRVIDDTIPGDPETTALISLYRDELSRKTLGTENFSWDSPIGETKFDIPLISDESPVGNLLTDAVAWNLQSSGIVSPEEPLVVIESNGLIRAQINKGETGIISAGDLFTVSPLGFGPGEELGYPMLLMYLTGEDLKKSMEVITTVAPLMGDDYILQFSGMKVKYNPHRMLFDRVTGIETETNMGFSKVDLKGREEKLYKVCVNTYIGSMLAVVGDHTGGILDIVPRNKDGKSVTDINSYMIDMEPGVSGIQELKEWKALQNYMRNLPDTNGNGLPDVPLRYSAPEGRIEAIPSLNPLSLLGGTWITTVTSLAVLLILIILFLAVFFTVRIIKRKILKKRNHVLL